MDAWSIGLVVLVVVGLAVILGGALWDRRRNRRRAAEMLAPPSRVIPQFRPDAPAPHYLSELQARRPPADTPPPALSPAAQAALRSELAGPDSLQVRSGYASADFVTDRGAGWAVLDEPVVCVCDDEVASTRELLGLLERLILARTPLVLVAPAMAADVLATLGVNRIQQRLAVVVVLVPDPAERARLAKACGARPTGRSDRQAGYLPSEDLGHCPRWVSTASTSHLLTGRTTAA